MLKKSPFWNGKKVFLTGHTGFKGGWLSLWLASLGAEVYGYSLPPTGEQNFYEIVGVKDVVQSSVFGDIRDFELLNRELIKCNPEIVLHLAAQPLVRYSYQNPLETYATNVMGTVNLLESMRSVEHIRSTVIVTTDKCYENREWEWGYREIDRLGGHDPYSNSKACAELCVESYRKSFFSKKNIEISNNSIATARAGNVIGGGDWSLDRLVPDILRASNKGGVLNIRNPDSTRPWQHVLEPLSGYLMLAEALYEKGSEFSSPWNFGPNYEDALPVKQLIEMMNQKLINKVNVQYEKSDHAHEANFLKLDCSKSIKYLGWHPKWCVETALEKTISWD